MADKIKAWFKYSVTILWARLQVLAGLAMASAMGLLADPNISGAVQSVLKPQYIPYYIIGIGLITELARRRSMAKE